MTGMLWFDNTPQKDLAAKLAEAAAYYQAKYGAVPNAAQVHPSTPLPTDVGAHGVRLMITPSRSILPNHILIGVISPPHFVSWPQASNGEAGREV